MFLCLLYTSPSYGSRGFRRVGRRKNYYDHPKEDAIIMTKEFGAAEAEAEQ